MLEHVLLSVTIGAVATTAAIAPTIANCTSVTQADVDQMNEIEKSITKNAREYLFGLKGSEEQLVFEDADAREYLLDDETVKRFAEDTGESEEDIKRDFTAIADINDVVVNTFKTIGEGLREGASEDDILDRLSGTDKLLIQAVNPVWESMGYSGKQFESDLMTLKFGNFGRAPGREYTDEELEMMQPLVDFGNKMYIQGFGY